MSSLTMTLRNEYHGTKVRVQLGPLSPWTVRRIRRTLCGMTDCICGGPLGERGMQDAEILYDKDGGIELRAWPPKPRMKTADELKAQFGDFASD
jgi:hypothetical protein